MGGGGDFYNFLTFVFGVPQCRAMAKHLDHGADHHVLNRFGQNETAANWFEQHHALTVAVRAGLRAGLLVEPGDRKYLPLADLLVAQEVQSGEILEEQALEPAQPRMQQETRQPSQRRQQKRNVREDPSFRKRESDSIIMRPIDEREAMQGEAQRMGAALHMMAKKVLEQYPIGHRYPINDSRYNSIEVYPSGGGMVTVLLWAQGGQDYQSLIFNDSTGMMKLVDEIDCFIGYESVPYMGGLNIDAKVAKDLGAYRTMAPLMTEYLERAMSAEARFGEGEDSPDGVEESAAPTHPDVFSEQERNSRSATCRALALDLAASAHTALGDYRSRGIEMVGPSRFAGERLYLSKVLSTMTVSIASYGQIVLDERGAIIGMQDYDDKSDRQGKVALQELNDRTSTMALRMLRELNACFLMDADPELAKTPVAQTVQALWEIASMAEGERITRLPQSVGDFEVMEVEKYGTYLHVRVRDVAARRAILGAEFNTSTGFVELLIDDENNPYRSLGSFPFLAKAIGMEEVDCRDPQFDAYAAQLLTLVRSKETMVSSEKEAGEVA